MAAFTRESGTSFDGASSLEVFLRALISFGQAAEQNALKNPDIKNYLTSRIEEDSSTLVATATIPINLNNGKIVVGDYLINSGYVAATTGTITGSNWVEDLILATLLMKAKEQIPNNSTHTQEAITWSIESNGEGDQFNATFTANYNVPLTTAQDPNGGGTLFTAKVYLTV